MRPEEAKRIDIMDPLHKREKDAFEIEPKEGQRDLLCSNKASIRCPSLGFNNSFASEDDALDYLAEVLVDSFLDKQYGTEKYKASGDLLPSFD